MKALSIRQPWAWLIVHGIKDIENRTWCPSYRGMFYVHAGKSLDGTVEERERIRQMVRERYDIEMPEDDDLPRGGIVGSAILSHVVERSSSPWFKGPIGFVLEQPIPLPFRAMAGRLSFFEVRS